MYLKPNQFQQDSQASTYAYNSREILAHYKIELQKCKKKLGHQVQCYQQQIAELEMEVRTSSKKNQPKKQENYLKSQLEFKKGQVQNLKRLLLKITDKKTFHELNTIDEALIPQQTPQQIIRQKQRTIKQLSQELAIAQQKFQGKYFIEHKAINQFQVQMQQNKKLKAYVLQSENERQNYAKNQRSRQKTIANTVWYYKQYQKQEKRKMQLTNALNKLQSKDSLDHQRLVNFEESQFKYLENLQAEYVALNNQLQEDINNMRRRIQNQQKITGKKQNIQQDKTIQKINRNIHNVRWNKQDNQQSIQQGQSQSNQSDSISHTIRKQKLDWNLRIQRQVDEYYNMQTCEKDKKGQKDKYKQFGLDDIYRRK